MKKTEKTNFFGFVLCAAVVLVLWQGGFRLAWSQCDLKLPDLCPVSDVQMTIDANEIPTGTEDHCDNILDISNQSLLDTTLSGVSPGSSIVVDGTYLGWCIDLNGSIYEDWVYRVDLYSSLDPPDFIKAEIDQDKWNGINWILNNKQGNWLDVQAAIWKLVEGYFPDDFPYGEFESDDGCPAHGEPAPDKVIVENLVESAEDNSGFTPGTGEIVAIIVVAVEETGGDCNPEDDVQLTIIESTCCGACKGGVTELTLEYTGTSLANIVVYEGKDSKPDKILFDSGVSPNEEFTFSGAQKDGKMGKEISVWVNDALNTKIHTSCSKPIGPGLISGDFLVVEGLSKDGGQLCPLPECLECKGGVTELTLEYTGTSPADIVVYEGKDIKPDKVLFEKVNLNQNEAFTFSGAQKDGKMGKEISVWVDGELNTEIHTSCSKPIGPGLISGDFLVVEGLSKDGGQLCPLPECLECKGGVTELTLEYTGTSPADIVVYEGKDIKPDKVLFEKVNLNQNEAFTFSGAQKDGKMGKEISVWVDGELNTEIHTSCSKPIGPGLISGDFLVVEGLSKDGGQLCPLPECLECKGGVTELTLEYTGMSSANIMVYEGKDPKPDKVLFANLVNPNEEFTFSGAQKDGKMGKEISVWVDGALNTEIHTSCSKSIGPGLISGDFLVVEGFSKDGGKICPLKPPEPVDECTTKVQAMLLLYTGVDIPDATVEFDPDKGATVTYANVDLESNVTILSSPSHNGWTIDATVSGEQELGSKTKIRINGVEEVIHTSCSTPFVADAPAPLDSPKGDPSLNWFVEGDFLQKP